jgi:small subunit ribosomal protein S6|tara:strand:- start:4415 stop:4960 length:546 start_codon:yes stop_codon:yes gene_type:complete
VPFYESVFIARQDVSTSQVDGLTDTFEKIIKDLGGSVTKKESWGLRTMAYRVKKNRKGHYVLMNIDAPADAIKEMGRQMHLNEDVIRHLTTRVDELEEGPSAVLRAKERGDDRGRRSGRDEENGYDNRPSFDKGPGKDAKPGPDDSKPKDAKAGDKPAPEAESSQPDDSEPKDEKAEGGDA